ncbi:hypothetical protein Dimus_003506, partial [Dionaea muscipula]
MASPRAANCFELRATTIRAGSTRPAVSRQGMQAAAVAASDHHVRVVALATSGHHTQAVARAIGLLSTGMRPYAPALHLVSWKVMRPAPCMAASSMHGRNLLSTAAWRPSAGRHDPRSRGGR